ncbi:MAG: NADH-quinone oxidoreductase subunit K [Anaerolineales bacterium]|nr:NADH-quinone oxidoreductase subunit K [Anaerolineales bacterium]
MSLAPLQIAVLGVIGLLGAGFYGLLAGRNLIKIVVALQVLVKGALLGLVAAGSVKGQVALGESLAVTVIVADTIVAVMGIALGVQIRRRVGTLDVKELSKLRG